LSKFCGVFHFDFRPLSEDEGRVRSALNGPGCPTSQTCRQPGLFMGWAGAGGPQAQGLFEGLDRNVCLWDGRIDNREHLLGKTELHPDCCDAALVLSTYQKRGIDGLRDIIGDWSVCIWDSGRREIVLASDYAGIRPLYYHRSSGSLYWSSSLDDVVRWSSATQLDDAYAASFLTRGNGGGRTPYAEILPVPPGHAVFLDRNGMVNRAFWTLPVHQETRYPDETQYEERLLELFRESVRVRLATDSPTCAELSGGLDSSSIVCMADRILRERPGDPSELITFSYAHENSPDEKFYRAVEQVCRVSAYHLELDEHPAAAADCMGAVPGLWEPRFQGLARRMAALGSGVLLTGQFGDFIMGNTHDDTGQVAEWFAKGQPRKAAKTAYAWARAMQTPIYPILWRGMREAYSSWLPSPHPDDSVGAIRASREDSLASGLRARLAEIETERPSHQPAREFPPGRRRRFQVADEVLRSRTLQTPNVLQHLSVTHPYAHRPLVEFMLTIPAAVVVSPDQPRRLMRRAFACLLPPMVLNRKSKASYLATYRESLLPLAAKLLKNSEGIQVVERGYVDRASLMGRLEKFTQGLDCNETQLRQIILFEFWLRAHELCSQESELSRRSAFAAS
jgi:asparagine synthase (glutamine-hydrolysing)